MNRTVIFLPISLLFLLIGPQAIKAQTNPTAAQPAASEVAALRRKLEAQEAQINRLQQATKQQAEMLDRQQRLLETLQQKLKQTGGGTGAPASPPAAASDKPAEKKLAIKNGKEPESVESGFGKITFNGLLQGWYAGGDSSFRDTFRLRRAELKFGGRITDKAGWTVMIDPAKALSLNNTFTTINGTKVLADTSVNQASRILQDAFVTIDYIKNVHLDVGQFKLPLSLEGLQSSAKLETVERALFASDRARGGTFGDIRDLGVMIRGSLAKYVDYQVGLFNGTGENQNDLDKNDQKAVIARLVARPPFLPGLQIGGSGGWSNGRQPDRPRHDRVGAELLYTHKPFMFKSELMTGTDGDLHRVGYYTHFGYRINPKVEAIFRFDSWDPDTRFETNSSNVTERDYIAGFNYFITENNVKLQVNYLRKTFNQGITPSRNLILINLQTSW
jgi:uncharacterized coiled-coil protein SlyX